MAERIRAKEDLVDFVNKIKSLLGLDFAEKADREIKNEEEEAGRPVAQRFSRGSVGIQADAFQTTQQHDDELRRAGLPPRKRDHL